MHRIVLDGAPHAFAGYFEELLAALPAAGRPPDPVATAALWEGYDLVPVDTQQD